MKAPRNRRLLPTCGSVLLKQSIRRHDLRRRFARHALLGCAPTPLSLTTSLCLARAANPHHFLRYGHRYRVKVMAIQMALNGGLGLIHYNMSDEKQVREVTRVKNHIHGFIQEPIKVAPIKKSAK